MYEIDGIVFDDWKVVKQISNEVEKSLEEGSL